MAKYVVAIDQGTTSSRAILFDYDQNMVSVAQKEFTQIYPNEGWVEHNASEIWATQFGVLQEAIQKAGAKPEDIAAIGITNQRETTVVWDKNTGEPIYNAIVWQCRRTASICDAIKSKGLDSYIRENTGLVIDAYFSGTKIKWILDNVAGARDKAKKGELLFGTIDTWLIWKLTGGKVHVTDYTNASRTMIYNIKELKWDEKILKELDIPESMLPEVKDSSEVYGYANINGKDVPISGIAGDQQAALFGQACFDKGDIKNTYGTGSFILMNIGEKFILSKNGLLTTIGIGYKGKIEYALEGSVFIAGAVIQWIRDELRLLHDAKDTEYFATKVKDTNGVYLVPAFVGLGAPYWDMYARGCIVGLTRGVNRAHIARAVLEAITLQVKDLLLAIDEDSGIELAELRVDGGASVSNIMMQIQSNMIGTYVNRPKTVETTALGAAYLAGLAVGVWKDLEEIETNREVDRVFVPEMDKDTRDKIYKGWIKAVERAKSWEEIQ